MSLSLLCLPLDTFLNHPYYKPWTQFDLNLKVAKGSIDSQLTELIVNLNFNSLKTPRFDT